MEETVRPTRPARQPQPAAETLQKDQDWKQLARCWEMETVVGRDAIVRLERELKYTREALHQREQDLSALAKTKPYRLAHLLRRIERDFFKSNRKDRKEFLSWLWGRLAGRQLSRQEARNPLLDALCPSVLPELETPQLIEAEGLLREVAPLLKRSTDRLSIALQLDCLDKGGLEEVVLSLARELQRRGSFNLYIFVNDSTLGYLGSEAVKQGLRVILLHRNPFFLRSLIQILELKLVNLHYSLFGVDEYARANVKIIYTIQNNYVWTDSDRLMRERKAAYDGCHVFVAVSEQVRHFFIEKFGVPADRVTTINNALDLQLLQTPRPLARDSLGLRREDFVFINVAAFNWNKFHVLLVAAMRRLKTKYPQLKMLFVGHVQDRDCYERITQLIEDYDLRDEVRIFEYVPKEEVLGLLNLADCFVLPSLTEGCSMAALEAMYCGLPLILSDVGAARDLIVESDIGLIIPQPYEDLQKVTSSMVAKLYGEGRNLDTLEHLCVAMQEIYLNSRTWKTKAQKGREKVQKVFNVQTAAARYVAAFEKALKCENTPAKVGIILLSYNRADVVLHCLRSLARGRTRLQFEVYLVDNNSQDNQYEAIRREWDCLQQRGALSGVLHRSESNLGFPKGNNLGLKHFFAREDITHICLLNSDVIATDYWLDRLVGSGFDAVGPVTNACGNEQTIPIPFTPQLGEDNFTLVNEFAQNRHELFRGCAVQTDFLGFFCFLAKKKVMQQVGLLDERFGRGAYEDDDYCLRLLQAGYTQHILRDTFVFHWGNSSFSQIPFPELFKHLDGNKRLFEQKYGIQWADRKWLPMKAFSQDMQFLLPKYSSEEVLRQFQLHFQSAQALATHLAASGSQNQAAREEK